MSIMDDVEGKGKKLENRNCKSATANKSNEVQDGKSNNDVNQGNNSGEILQRQKAVLKRNLNHIKLPFPWKVQEMLSNVEKEGNSHIVSWLHHGKSFRVHKQEEFVASIMPSYFNQTKFTSFTRQLYIYGFQKIQEGPDKGAFFHSKFVRNNKALALQLKRKRDKPGVPAYMDQRNKRGIHLSDSEDAKLGGYKLPEPLRSYDAVNPMGTSNSILNGGIAQNPLPQSNDATFPPSLASLPQLSQHQSCAELPPRKNVQQQSQLPLPLTVQAPNNEEDDEEDWLAKYERLTYGESSWEKKTPVQTKSQPNPILSNSTAQCEQVRGEDWLVQCMKVLSKSNVANNSALVNSINTLVNVPQTDALSQNLQLHSRHNERLQPRCIDNCDFHPLQRPFRFSASSEQKEIDVLSDGDEVDFEGMKFHFLEK